MQNLTIDAFTLGLLAVICLAIGFLLAVLMQNLRQAEGRVEESTAEESSADGQSEDERLTEVFRLYRREAGDVVPQVRGDWVPDASDLNAEVHALLSLGLVDLYAWMEAGHRPAPQVQAEPGPEQETVGESDVTDQTKDAEEEPKESGPESSEEESTPAASGRFTSLNPLKSLVRTAQAEINENLPEEAPSIAAQVDEILQSRLEGSPLAERAIRLLDLPNQGMVILVGLEKYLEIEEVPDEEIKEVLKSAVAEWEGRMLSASRRGSSK